MLRIVFTFFESMICFKKDNYRFRTICFPFVNITCLGKFNICLRNMIFVRGIYCKNVNYLIRKYDFLHSNMALVQINHMISGAPKGRYLPWREPVPDPQGALPRKPGEALNPIYIYIYICCLFLLPGMSREPRGGQKPFCSTFWG